MRAQEEQTYQGPLSVSGYHGDADYTYLLVDGDTVLNGPFRLRKANLDALLQKQDYSFDFKGNFRNNFPVGPWRFQFGTFQSNNESQVVDYQYRVAISGVQEEASGNMVNGKPDGTWQYSVNEIEDSEVSKSLFKSNISFENGVPQRNFRIENDSLTLAGRFLRNGLAHDEWSLFETTGIGAAESWFFNDGILREIRNDSNGRVEVIPIYTNDLEESKTINLDARYINAVAIWQSLERTSHPVVNGKMQRLLSENASYYKKIDGILSELGESAFLPEFKVKVPYYPFTETEQVQLDSIATNFFEAKKISDAYLENTQLSILKLSDSDAAYLFEVITKIDKDYLKPIAKFVAYKNEGVVEFLPKEKLIQHLWSNGKPDKQISVTVNLDSTMTERAFEIDNVADFNFVNNDVNVLKQITDYALHSLLKVESLLNKKLINQQRQQELIAIEEDLISKNKQLQQLIDSTNNTISNSQKNALQQLKQLADNKLSDYSSIDEIKTKLDRGQELTICYRTFLDLAKSISVLPEKWESIQKNYQDRIWNPFMATLMDEEVKKRITGSYRRVLVPYYLEQVNTELTCAEAKKLDLLIQSTYQRMLELRIENTSKLERKLRKATDPEVVLELFGLTTEKPRK